MTTIQEPALNAAPSPDVEERLETAGAVQKTLVTGARHKATDLVDMINPFSALGARRD